MDIKTFWRTTPSSVGRSGIDWSTNLFLTYQLTMALYIETSWCPYQLFHRTFTIDLTASIVSCVVYTTFVGNSLCVSCRLPHLNWITKNLKLRLRCSKAFCVLTSVFSFGDEKFNSFFNNNWMGLVVYISTNSEFELTKAGFPRWQATFNFFHFQLPLYDENQKSFYKDRGCVHYVIVSEVQWEPFQPATQLYVHKMTALGGKIVWTMTYAHRPNLWQTNERTTGMF